jgi:predicted glycosyltransferase
MQLCFKSQNTRKNIAWRKNIIKVIKISKWSIIVSSKSRKRRNLYRRYLLIHPKNVINSLKTSKFLNSKIIYENTPSTIR